MEKWSINYCYTFLVGGKIVSGANCVVLKVYCCAVELHFWASQTCIPLKLLTKTCEIKMLQTTLNIRVKTKLCFDIWIKIQSRTTNSHYINCVHSLWSFYRDYRLDFGHFYGNNIIQVVLSTLANSVYFKFALHQGSSRLYAPFDIKQNAKQNINVSFHGVRILRILS